MLTLLKSLNCISSIAFSTAGQSLYILKYLNDGCSFFHFLRRKQLLFINLSLSNSVCFYRVQILRAREGLHVQHTDEESTLYGQLVQQKCFDAQAMFNRHNNSAITWSMLTTKASSYLETSKLSQCVADVYKSLGVLVLAGFAPYVLIKRETEDGISS